MTTLPALRRGGGRTRHSWRGAIAAGFAAAVAAMVLPGCGAGQPGSTAGSGVAAAQGRTVARFTGVDLTGSSQVTVTVGQRQSVVVHADRNLLRNVTTRVVGGVLEIGTTGRFTTKVPMNVEVSVPSLTGLKLSGSGQVTATGITARALSVSLPGSGSLDLSGTVTRLDVTLGGSGQAQLSHLTARDVHAVLSGSGRIQLTATSSLDAAVPGSGTISYGGDPAQVKSNVTGSGTVDRS
jgi:hypothetical protein